MSFRSPATSWMWAKIWLLYEFLGQCMPTSTCRLPVRLNQTRQPLISKQTSCWSLSPFWCDKVKEAFPAKSLDWDLSIATKVSGLIFDDSINVSGHRWSAIAMCFKNLNNYSWKLSEEKLTVQCRHCQETAGFCAKFHTADKVIDSNGLWSFNHISQLIIL